MFFFFKGIFTIHTVYFIKPYQDHRVDFSRSVFQFCKVAKQNILFFSCHIFSMIYLNLTNINTENKNYEKYTFLVLQDD